MDFWDLTGQLAPAGAAALIAAFIAKSASALAKRQRPEPPVQEDSLADRIQRLSATAVLAKVLADEIAAEVALLGARAGRLNAQAKEAEMLAELNKQHREAVAAVIREELDDQDRSRRKSSFWVNGLWFVAGVIASVAVTLFVRPLT